MMGLTSFDTIPYLSADSLHKMGTYFQKLPVTIHPRVVHAAGSSWIFYLLFGLLALIAFIRFFYPATTQAVFSWFSGAGFRKSENNFAKQGLLVPIFLIINFMVSITLLILVIQVNAGANLENISSSPRFWLVAVGAVACFFLYNLISTLLMGFIFDTRAQASMQVKNISAWAYISGLFLTPFLLIYSYSGSAPAFYAVVGGMTLLLLFKWFQTVKIGLLTKDFNVLHLFLYLCAVEIIPLFLLVKLFVE